MAPPWGRDGGLQVPWGLHGDTMGPPRWAQSNMATWRPHGATWGRHCWTQSTMVPSWWIKCTDWCYGRGSPSSAKCSVGDAVVKREVAPLRQHQSIMGPRRRQHGVAMVGSKHHGVPTSYHRVTTWRHGVLSPPWCPRGGLKAPLRLDGATIGPPSWTHNTMVGSNATWGHHEATMVGSK